MLHERLENEFLDCEIEHAGILIDRDVIEIRVQKDPVFWITSVCYGFKIYIGYAAPNSVDLGEVNRIADIVKSAIMV